MKPLNVVAYTAGIPAKNKNPEKPLILQNFIEGVNKVGDRGMLHDGMHLPTDAGLLQGWTHIHGAMAPHLQVRKSVIEGQRKIKKRTITADSNLFLYKDTSNPKHYLRYSFDGIFPTTGEYCDNNIDPNRWNSLKRNIGLDIKPWRTTGDHIVICLQRNGGWSMKGTDVQDWAISVITELRKYTDRKIIIRAHPGDGKTKIYLNPNMPQYKLKGLDNVVLSNNQTPFVDDLRNAWAVIGHNSSPAVGAAIEGIPVFLTDPIDSQAREVAHTDLSTIENTKEFDRQSWLERLSMFHWNFEELRSGECWSHMRQYIKP
jgi:hypothetical protein